MKSLSWFGVLLCASLLDLVIAVPHHFTNGTTGAHHHKGKGHKHKKHGKGAAKVADFGSCQNARVVSVNGNKFQPADTQKFAIDASTNAEDIFRFICSEMANPANCNAQKAAIDQCVTSLEVALQHAQSGDTTTDCASVFNDNMHPPPDTAAETTVAAAAESTVDVQAIVADAATTTIVQTVLPIEATETTTTTSVEEAVAADISTDTSLMETTVLSETTVTVLATSVYVITTAMDVHVTVTDAVAQAVTTVSQQAVTVTDVSAVTIIQTVTLATTIENDVTITEQAAVTAVNVGKGAVGKSRGGKKGGKKGRKGGNKGITTAAAAAISTTVDTATTAAVGEGRGGVGKGAKGGKGGKGSTAADSTTADTAAASTASDDSVSAVETATATAGDQALVLDPKAVQTGSASDGLDVAAVEKGQAASATSDDNFINFCAGKTLTNGLQVKGGSCNGIVMGNLPPSTNMVSQIIVFPGPGKTSKIKANTNFTISVQSANLEAGSFTNPTITYYAAPQTLKNNKVVGHTHVTVQDLGNSLTPSKPPDATTFVFFKGINDAGNGNGLLSAVVTGGLPAGNYRVCTLGSASNHQPVLMPVAQRGAQDDCQKFVVA